MYVVAIYSEQMFRGTTLMMYITCSIWVFGMSNRKLVSFRLPDDLMQDLREQADRISISVTELVCRLLRQGLKHQQEHLQSDNDEQAKTSRDKRIFSLEEELQELKQSQQPAQAIGTIPLQTFLAAQSLIGHDSIEIKSRLTQLEKMHKSEVEMSTRLTEIEQMVKTLVDRIQE